MAYPFCIKNWMGPSRVVPANGKNPQRTKPVFAPVHCTTWPLKLAPKATRGASFSLISFPVRTCGEPGIFPFPGCPTSCRWGRTRRPLRSLRYAREIALYAKVGGRSLLHRWGGSYSFSRSFSSW